MPAPSTEAHSGLTLLVTRPAAQAGPWVDALRAQGCAAVALPLLGIEPLADRSALIDAWTVLPRYALLMFVSANAVEHFFAARPAAPDAGSWPAGTRAASTGPGTTAALRRAGVPLQQIVEPRAEGGRFDSEALWLRLQLEPWQGRRVRVVRGEDGRDWLAAQFEAAGAQVDFLAAYRRVAPRWDAEAVAAFERAVATPAAHRWLISSSEALGHLGEAAVAHRREAVDWTQQVAWATHPRIADACRAFGFGGVSGVAPDPVAVAARARAEQPAGASGGGS